MRPQDIKDFPVWVAHQQLEGNVLSGWLVRDEQSLNIVSTFNLITTPAMMIEEGFAMALTFDKLVNTTGDSSLCFRPVEPPVETSFWSGKSISSVYEAGENLFRTVTEGSVLTSKKTKRMHRHGCARLHFIL